MSKVDVASIVSESLEHGLDLFTDIQSGTDWEQAVLRVVAGVLKEHGLDGVPLVGPFLDDLMDGKPVDLKVHGLSLREASDVLAALQNAEADRKKEVNDFLAVVSTTIGKVVSSLLSGVLG